MKSKVLIVTIETAWVGALEVVEIELDGSETEEELEDMAKEEFGNYCNYGWRVEE
ncbi:hypothetical protein OOU56_004463 [Salmonella enterica]|nr:hypothetical protein [Salmonella enterica]